MIPLYDELEKADMIVYASPIYFWHITSQLKAIIDRMYALYMSGRNCAFRGKDTAAIFVCGGNISCCNKAISFYKNIIVGRLNCSDKGMLLVSGTTPESFDLEAQGFLIKAYNMGASIR